MTVGDTEKLTATVLPEHAGYDGLVWSSNNTSVALVDVEGLVTAVSAGNATITATVGGIRATCEVTVADAVPEGLTVTTYEALLEALRTGGASADVPTLIMLGSDITIPAGGDHTNPPINGSGYFKIDGGGHTLTWEGEDNNNFHFLRQCRPRRRCRLYRTHQYQSGPTRYEPRGSCLQRQDYAGQRRGIERAI